MIGIKDFEMPKNCLNCPFHFNITHLEKHYCLSSKGGNCITIEDINNKNRPDCCPLVEIKED